MSDSKGSTSLEENQEDRTSEAISPLPIELERERNIAERRRVEAKLFSNPCFKDLLQAPRQVKTSSKRDPPLVLADSSHIQTRSSTKTTMNNMRSDHTSATDARELSGDEEVNIPSSRTDLRRNHSVGKPSAMGPRQNLHNWSHMSSGSGPWNPTQNSVWNYSAPPHTWPQGPWGPQSYYGPAGVAPPWMSPAGWSPQMGHIVDNQTSDIKTRCQVRSVNSEILMGSGLSKESPHDIGISETGQNATPKSPQISSSFSQKTGRRGEP